MTNLSQLLIASLLMRGMDRNGDRRGNMFSSADGASEDLRAARERAKKRS